MTHTPGPWEALLDKPKMKPMALVRTSDGDICIDCTGSGNDYNEDCANARLIAAAPDLLAATQKEQEWRDREAAGALDEAWDYETMVGQYRRAAIAKATGAEGR